MLAERLQRHGAGDVVGGGLAVEVDDALVGAAAEEEVGVALLQNEGLAFLCALPKQVLGSPGVGSGGRARSRFPGRMEQVPF